MADTAKKPADAAPDNDPYKWLTFGQNVDYKHESPGFLARLNDVGRESGKIIDVFSGYRSPDYSASVGGYSTDPHTRGVAADANVSGVPVGEAIPQSSFAKYGLESGNQPNFYNGQPDPSHVQVTGSGVDKSITGIGAPTGAGETPSQGPATAPVISGWDDFWNAVLKALGAPQNTANREFLASWADEEGTSANFNPLATTLPLGGSTTLAGNGPGVQEYPTAEIGSQATAQTIQTGYPSILALLRGGDPGTWIRNGRAGVDSDLRKWVSGRRTADGLAPDAAATWTKTTTDYVNAVKVLYQGGKGSLDARDWTSYDGSDAVNAAKNAASKALGPLASIYKGLAWLIGNPGRVGLIVAGTGLTAVGVVMLAKGAASPTGSPVRDATQAAGVVKGGVAGGAARAAGVVRK